MLDPALDRGWNVLFSFLPVKTPEADRCGILLKKSEIMLSFRTGKLKVRRGCEDEQKTHNRRFRHSGEARNFLFESAVTL